MTDCHTRGPSFDTWLHPRNFSMNIEPTQPLENERLAARYQEQLNPIHKTEIKAGGFRHANHVISCNSYLLSATDSVGRDSPEL